MSNVERKHVASSNIASIGYDEKTETLEVEFLNGSIYQYYNVPLSIHQQIMQEGSKGMFFNQYVKNAYPYSRV